MAIRVGDRGVACTDLRPIGYVTVNGQRLDAHSPHGVIPSGTPVVAVGSDHTGLIVHPESAVPHLLSDHGTDLLVGFTDRVDAQAARCEERAAEWSAAHRRNGTRIGLASGAAGCGCWLWNELPGTGEPYLAALALVAFGAVVGFGLFRLLDAWAAEADTGFRRVTPAAVPLGLAGAFGTAAGCVPVLSFPVALLAAAVVGLFALSAPFAFALLAGDS